MLLPEPTLAYEALLKEKVDFVSADSEHTVTSDEDPSRRLVRVFPLFPEVVDM